MSVGRLVLRPTPAWRHLATPLPNKAAGIAGKLPHERYPGLYDPKKTPIMSTYSTLEGAALFPQGTKNSPVLRSPGIRVQRFTAEKVLKWGFEWAAWGVALGAAGLWIVSLIPRVQSDFLQYIPVIGEYYKDKVPDSDKWL